MLVDFLAQQGIISEDLRNAIARRGGDDANATLRSLLGDDSVDPDSLAEAIARFTDVEYARLDLLPLVRAEVLGVCPARIIGEYAVLPLGVTEDGELCVGCLNPTDEVALQMVSLFAGVPVRPYTISARHMADVLAIQFGEVWPEPWTSLLGKFKPDWKDSAELSRRKLERASERDDALSDGETGETSRELAASIERGASGIRLPLRSSDVDQSREGRLERMYEPTPPAIQRSDPDGDELVARDIREAFRHPSEPAGYPRVDSGVYTAAQSSGRSRVAGYFGDIETMLRRSREVSPTATRAFELAAAAAELGEDREDSGQYTYAEVVEALSVAYPLSALWVVRNDHLVLAASDAEGAQFASAVGRTFPVLENSEWQRVANSGFAYRGRVSPRSPLSAWLLEQDAHHLWIVPVFVESRLIVMLSVTSDANRELVLPEKAAFAMFARAMASNTRAPARTLRQMRGAESHD